MSTLERFAEVKSAKAKMVEGALVIWNARLDALIESGNVREALDHLISPVEWGDNCDCQGNCSCDPAGLLQNLQQVSKPLETIATKTRLKR